MLRSAREVAVAIIGLAVLTGCGGGPSAARCGVEHDIDGRSSASAAAQAFFDAVHADDLGSACRLVAPNFSLTRAKFNDLVSTYKGHHVQILVQDRVDPNTSSLIATAENTKILTLNAIRTDDSEWVVLVGSPHNTSGTDQPSSAP